MEVTIKDVAREANVAPSTVSRVIQDSPSISEATKKRVREVMERLGYYPNFQAQSLAGRSSRAIGVVMPNSAFQSFQNPFFAEVLRGIAKVANQQRYGIYLSTSATEESIYEEVVTMVQGKRVAGVLLLYSRKDDALISYLMKANVPFTVIGRPYKKEQQITYVDNDNIQIAIEMTEYLIQLGHKRIAFIGGNLEFVVTLDRLKGYEEALGKHGIDLDHQLIANHPAIEEETEQIIHYFMSLPSPPTAIVTQDDLIAYKILSHLEALEIRVPDDVSILSINNHTLSEHSRPPLSSVDIGIVQLGCEATSCLIEQIELPSTLPKRITIPTSLIIRESCKPVCQEQNSVQ